MCVIYWLPSISMLNKMTKKDSLSLMATLVGDAVRKNAGKHKNRWSWYTPFMAAASEAISQRIPVVDFVLDLRDARIPLSSECEIFKRLSSSSSSRRIIVLNKVDLVSRSQVKECLRHFEGQKFPVFSVNSHNKDNIHEFLNFLQGQVRALKKAEPQRHTITMMLVGIPNVGKSALANSLHQIGRISATEKGRLKHAVVSPLPGETKEISGLKVASHPNIYVLDTPGILPPQIIDVNVNANFALTDLNLFGKIKRLSAKTGSIYVCSYTLIVLWMQCTKIRLVAHNLRNSLSDVKFGAGAFTDSLAGEKVLAQYFLSVLNLSNEYQKWEKLSTPELLVSVKDDNVASHFGSSVNRVLSAEDSLDHTKDSVVRNVRKRLFEAASSFKGNIHNQEELLRLIQTEFIVLKKAFALACWSEEEMNHKVAVKLLNLFRTGRLGHYVLDSIPHT
ncbi:DAR GTPase 2, mitochondrial isoform X3 [Amaranthus tricolor]|uniref:DAR GTPase 2, mitochondrial isoform X3 n=1 Tax=Amaranthus tricolor TaxID=29722 RepID=UPI00258EE252|nr:DAR GTPase 2, mitochondrial isoform X3 [Amaranthus tricolor]